jgi:hypothetical protein
MSASEYRKRPVGNLCHRCGKVSYLSRAAARKGRRLPIYRGEHMSIYRCGDYYHLGHLSPDVIAGEVGREVHNRKKVG